MKHLSPGFRLLIAAVALLFSVASCSTKDDPAPTTGAIAGIVSPATALGSVTATNSGGLTFPATPTANGQFTTANLVPGSYTLTFDPRPGFQTPATRTVVVTAGVITSAGTVAVAAMPQGTVTGTISPAGSVTQVRATSSTGTVVTATPDATTGVYGFTGLALDTYAVHFVTAPGFIEPVGQSVVLTVSSPTVALGTTTVSQGLISGVISPVEAATRVDVAASTGAITSVVPNAATGAFSLSGLAPGVYTVHFVTANGYSPQPDQTIFLTSGNPTAALGIVYFQRNGQPLGTMTWTVNGTTYTTTNLNTYATGSGIFSLEGISATGSTEDKVLLGVGNVNGPGQYPLGIFSFEDAVYTHSVNGNPVVYSGLTNNSAPVGTVSVMSYNPVTRAYVGTFNFVGRSSSGGTASITNGTFNVRF